MRPVISPLSCLLVVGLISCGQSPPPVEDRNLARVLPSDLEGIYFSNIVWERQKDGEEPGRDSPRILVEGRIFQAESGFFQGLGISDVATLKGLPREKWEDLLKVEDTQDQNKSMSFHAFESGHLTHSSIVHQTAFIQDYTFRINKSGKLVPEPRTGLLKTGASVKIRASLAGGEVEIREFLPEFVELLGERHCRAVVNRGEQSLEINWEEPVLLVATLDPEFSTPFRLNEGEILAISLPYRVRQLASSARALAAIGSLRESYENLYLPDEDHTGPLDLECVVLLGFRRLPPEKGAEEPTHE